jgi:hypothetical protein
MTHQQPQEEPFSEANLDSAEYRERLMRKLNCLIAVLEVATAKVRKSLATPSADTERLVRIRSNLQSTLDVCLRARAALERRDGLPKGLPEQLGEALGGTKALSATTSRGELVELVSELERERFRRLGPIDKRALARVDLDELARRLQG